MKIYGVTIPPEFWCTVVCVAIVLAFAFFY